MPQPLSFTRYGIEKMLSSDIFYPSNCKLQPIQSLGSIRRSVTKEHLLNAEELNSSIHTLGKPLRCVARVVAIVAISTLFAPIGVLYHGVMIIKYSCIWLKNGGKSPAFLSKHVWCFLTDALFTGIVLGGIWAVNKLKQESDTQASRYLGSLILSTFSMACLPQYLLPLIAYREERVPLFKAIELRNQFGIVAENGSLLATHLEEDQESLDDSSQNRFQQLYVAFGIDLLFQIQELQALLPRDQQIPHHYPPNPNTIASHLKRLNLNLERRRSIEQRFVQFQKTYRRLTQLGDFIKHSLEAKMTIVGSRRRQRVEMPSFPVDIELTYPFFIPAQVPPDFPGLDSDLMDRIKWMRDLDMAKNDLSQLNTSQLPPQLKVLEEKVKNNSTPHALLGFDEMPKDRAQVKKAYMRLTMFTHPDKNPGEHFLAAQALFRICNAAYEYLLKKLPAQPASTNPERTDSESVHPDTVD